MSFWRTKKGKYVVSLTAILLFVGFSLFFFVLLSPQQIIDWVGVKNAYVLIFVMAIAGGFTTFNVIPYHIVLVTLASGGLNPLLLGVLAVSGVSIGDSTSYFVGKQGRVLLSEKTTRWFDRINRASGERPRMFMFLCFLYSTFIPTSNDLLTIPAGIAGIPFWRVMIPLLFGNKIFDTALAYLSVYATDFVHTYML